MDLVESARTALALLFAAAIASKLTGNRPLAATIAHGLGVSPRLAGVLAQLTLVTELAVVPGLLWPETAPAAALISFAWVAGAASFWAIALPAGVEGCGCLGRFDPLRRVGPARRFAYLAPYATLSALLAGDALTSGATPSLLVAVPVGFAGLVVLATPTVTSVLGQVQERAVSAPVDRSRRRLLARAVLVGIAAFLAPLARPAAIFADTCGSWNCIRFYTICSCCTCSGGRSCDGCYKYVCRTCQGPYGNYQQCGYVIPTWCYANICSPCGRRYISSCGCCPPCPI